MVKHKKFCEEKMADIQTQENPGRNIHKNLKYTKSNSQNPNIINSLIPTELLNLIRNLKSTINDFVNNSHIREALKDTQSLNQNNTNSVLNWNTMMTRGQLRKQNQKEESNNQTLGSENEKLEEEDKPQPSHLGNTTN